MRWQAYIAANHIVLHCIHAVDVDDMELVVHENRDFTNNTLKRRKQEERSEDVHAVRSRFCARADSETNSQPVKSTFGWLLDQYLLRGSLDLHPSHVMLNEDDHKLVVLGSLQPSFRKSTASCLSCHS